MLLLLLAAHWAVGVAVLAAASRLRTWAFAVAALPMVATVAVVGSRWSTIRDGRAVQESVTWIGGLDLVADVRLDGFALLMVLLVSGMGIVVLGFAASYFDRSATSARIAGLLVLFAGSMLGLVLADHLIWLYVSWELTSVTSYLLIGREQKTAGQRSAALQALLVTGAGGLAMLAGFVVLAQAAGTWSMAELLADPPAGGAVGVGLGLVLLGVFTKSAQYPFHFWLPGAMVAPTPISAYLHSATMVKAGIYLVARFSPAFAEVGIWRPVVIGVGITTMIAGALRALRQDDLKLLLAFGTVSQLGFMLVLAGSGQPEATKAVCVLLVAHALFKGALFLVVGIVDHQTGTRDRRELAILDRGWTAVRVVAILSAASMAGLPPLAGFIAKESAYEAFLHDGRFGAMATLAGLFVGSILTFAYSARFVAPFLVGQKPSSDRISPAPTRRFVGPAVVLAVGSVVAGAAVSPVLGPLVDSAANSLDGSVGDPKLALWHGVNAALGLSVLTYVLGGVVVGGGMWVARAQARLAPPIRGDEVFGELVRLMNVFARRVTAIVQPGSLPLSIGVIMVVVIGTPVVALAAAGNRPEWGPFSELAAHPVLAAALVLPAGAVAIVRRRFAAVLLLGAVGYTMALIFALQGAPDLALTQFAVETLSIVVFMLVIRHLPERFRPDQFRAATALRIGVATFVAVGVFSLAMMTASGTGDRAVSDEIVARAEPDGGGKNVVNVILVDVRGLDTLGEITVLAVAAVGVVALARVGRRPGRASDPAPTHEVPT
ncbi:hydrogen gas-evolving membrane-bound hydrogenase subunit E [Actinospongicola halichondriae]|uniref:hydrogen gas-evolving membrane-bound hydrogenase subunit E n=1 Tax=Actinospongicola halichondriae TaxID=3236844 RepID=UPI003D4BEBDB